MVEFRALGMPATLVPPSSSAVLQQQATSLQEVRDRLGQIAWFNADALLAICARIDYLERLAGVADCERPRVGGGPAAS